MFFNPDVYDDLTFYYPVNRMVVLGKPFYGNHPFTCNPVPVVCKEVVGFYVFVDLNSNVDVRIGVDIGTKDIDYD